MGMDPESGDIRPLGGDFEPLRKKEVLWQVGELVSIKGCVFSVKKIYPNPDNELVLRGEPETVKEGNTI